MSVLEELLGHFEHETLLFPGDAPIDELMFLQLKTRRYPWFLYKPEWQQNPVAGLPPPGNGRTVWESRDVHALDDIIIAKDVSRVIDVPRPTSRPIIPTPLRGRGLSSLPKVISLADELNCPNERQPVVRSVDLGVSQRDQLFLP